MSKKLRDDSFGGQIITQKTRNSQHLIIFDKSASSAQSGPVLHCCMLSQGGGEDSEGARSRQLWGGQFWQVEGDRCCHQGRKLIMMMSVMVIAMTMTTITMTMES